jgi:LmbE family N-acetylglucosaminyl deacetylase
VDVHYACATRGEVGTVDAELLQGFATTGDLRWSELEAAVKILGLTGVHWLGYRDSGMPGSEDNRHPDALVQADHDVLVGKVVATIRTLRPQVIVTFDPCGGYGHPDHVSIHYAAKKAFGCD